MVKRVLVVVLAAALAVSGFGQAVRRKLMPQDTVRIQVFNQAQLNGDSTLDQYGDITPPFLPTVHASGKTVDELKDELRRLYIQYLFLKDPILSVTLSSARPLRATVGGGGVGRPGTYVLFPGETLLTLLNEGGGAIRDVADLRRAYLRHSGQTESIPIDLYSLTEFGDVTQNYEIQDGDQLIVPEERGNNVVVLGAVASPGQRPYREPTTAWDAIAQAGGEIRYRSRFSHTVVLRQRQGIPGEYVKIPIDLTRFIRKGDSSQNIQLQPGDIVYVPETNTPDFAQLGQIGNSAFLLDTLGRIIGLRLFR